MNELQKKLARRRTLNGEVDSSAGATGAATQTSSVPASSVKPFSVEPTSSEPIAPVCDDFNPSSIRAAFMKADKANARPLSVGNPPVTSSASRRLSDSACKSPADDGEGTSPTFEPSSARAGLTSRRASTGAFTGSHYSPPPPPTQTLPTAQDIAERTTIDSSFDFAAHRRTFAGGVVTDGHGEKKELTVSEKEIEDRKAS